MNEMGYFNKLKEVTLDTQQEFMDSPSSLKIFNNGLQKKLGNRIYQHVGSLTGESVAKVFSEPLAKYHWENLQHYQENHNIQKKINEGAFTYTPIWMIATATTLASSALAYHFHSNGHQALLGGGVGAFGGGIAALIFSLSMQQNAENKVNTNFRVFEPEIKRVADSLESKFK
jgi:hypothetical protein